MFEHNYDIAPFKDGDQERGFFGPHSNAPFYAKNQRYIEEHVNDPFEYIVLDHSRLTTDLMADGIDTQVFWNIWRLTPAVYRRGRDWLVKRELEKEGNATSGQAAYVLENAIDIALHKDRRRQLERLSDSKLYSIPLKAEGVSIYTRADRNSAVRTRTEPGMRDIKISFSTPALNGDGVYWFAADIKGGIGVDGTKPRLYFGYIHEDDVDLAIGPRAEQRALISEEVATSSRIRRDEGRDSLLAVEDVDELIDDPLSVQTDTPS